jgi:hypothetical protein
MCESKVVMEELSPRIGDSVDKNSFAWVTIEDVTDCLHHFRPLGVFGLVGHVRLAMYIDGAALWWEVGVNSDIAELVFSEAEILG